MRTILVFCLIVCGCGDNNNGETKIEWDPECAGTDDSNACLSLTISASNFVRQSAVDDVAGTLSWALYKEGDVDLAPKPGAVPVYSGDVDVDLLADDSTATFTVTNVTPQGYHPLGQLDDNGSGVPDDGDIVTLPPPAFQAPAGEHTERSMTLDTICDSGRCDQ